MIKIENFKKLPANRRLAVAGGTSQIHNFRSENLCDAHPWISGDVDSPGRLRADFDTIVAKHVKMAASPMRAALSSSSGHIISLRDTGANSFQREIVDRALSFFYVFTDLGQRDEPFADHSLNSILQ